MRYYFFLLLPILAACVPQQKYLTLDEELQQQCAAAGFKDKELDACVKSAYKAYNKELARQEKERAKAIEAARKAQLKADGNKCKEYGFQRGTSQFASCMMQIEQTRKQEQQHNAEFAAQQALAQQQLEATKRAALLQYLGQQQAIQAQQNIALQNQLKSNSLHCTTYKQGAFGNIDCY